MLISAPVGTQSAHSIHSLATTTTSVRFHKSHINGTTTRWPARSTPTWSDRTCKSNWLSFHTTTRRWAWSARTAVHSTDQCSSTSQAIAMHISTWPTTSCLEKPWRLHSRALRKSTELTTTSLMEPGAVLWTPPVYHTKMTMHVSLVQEPLSSHQESTNRTLTLEMAQSFLFRLTWSAPIEILLKFTNCNKTQLISIFT